MRFLLILKILVSFELLSGEVNSWECNKFEGAQIIGDDGDYLGVLGPSWKSDSIFNSSSPYGSTWSSDSIFNTSSKYGNEYSSTSVFNDNASDPPMIIGDEGVLGYLSIGPSYDSSTYSPYDFKYTCDWD
mgnify:CR=1 FL=1